MFKIMGSIIILLSATLFGMKKYNAIAERKKILQSIHDGSVQIENSLRCMCMPLYESFLGGGDFFKSAADKICSGALPEEAVKDTAYNIHVLNSEDLRIIQRFARGLCAQDCQGQLSNLGLFIKELEGEISHATDELNTRGKLYIKGSILTAAAIVLLLV